MDFVSPQKGLLLSILLLGFFLAVIAHLTKERNLSVLHILLYGAGCAIFGLVTACLAGRECFDVFLLKDTAGFGRAYVVGMGIVISAPFVLLLRLISKKQKKRGG